MDLEPIRMTVTWGSSRDNREGMVWLHVTAPFSEAVAASQLVFYLNKRVLLYAKVEGQSLQELGTVAYIGKSDTRDGEYKLNLESDLEHIDAEKLHNLKRSVTGIGPKKKDKKTFELLLITEELANQMSEEEFTNQSENVEEFEIEE